MDMFCQKTFCIRLPSLPNRVHSALSPFDNHALIGGRQDILRTLRDELFGGLGRSRRL